MKRYWPLLGLLATFLAPMHAQCADWKNLTGIFAVTSKNYLDGADENAPDSHFRIQLSGQAARHLFASMKVKEQPDECTGALARRVGDMTCLHYPSKKRYECHFSIDVMKQTIEYGVAC